MVRVGKPFNYDRFDERRERGYRQDFSVSELGPTSYSISGHVLRTFHLIRKHVRVCLLDRFQPQNNPHSLGWLIVREALRPSKCTNYLPPELLILHSCSLSKQLSVFSYPLRGEVASTT